MQLNEAAQSLNQYLTFVLAEEEYAISVLKVTEIMECVALTKVPGAPSWIRGVLNLRGAVVPVVDLAVKFGMARSEVTRRSCVIIVELQFDDERLVMGVMADSVDQVIELAPHQIQPAPSFGPRVRVDCILGMGTNNDKFVCLLDIDRILSSNEILVVSTAGDDDEAGEIEVLAEVAVG